MSRIECSRELEILDAVASGRWPNRADAELRAHASTCSICADVALMPFFSFFATAVNLSTALENLAPP